MTPEHSPPSGIGFPQIWPQPNIQSRNQVPEIVSSRDKKDGREAYEEFKRTVIDEINSLDIPGMPKINELYALVGNFVNLEYPLHNGQKVKFLDNNSMYLGNQVECELHKGRCYGMIACVDFLLVCEYGENGADPEIVLYKRR